MKTVNTPIVLSNQIGFSDSILLLTLSFYLVFSSFFSHIKYQSNSRQFLKRLHPIKRQKLFNYKRRHRVLCQSTIRTRLIFELRTKENCFYPGHFFQLYSTLSLQSWMLFFLYCFIFLFFTTHMIIVLFPRRHQ